MNNDVHQSDSCARRKLVIGGFGLGMAGLSAPTFGQVIAQPEGQAPFVVLTLATRNLPVNPIANCANLEAVIKHFEAELAKLQADFTGVGQMVIDRVKQSRSDLKAALKASQKHHEDSKVEEGFAQLNICLGALFVVAGAVFTGPYAIGILAATTILTGASVFGMQAFFKKDSKDPSFVVGFSRDRTIMFAELAGSNAASTTGKVLARSMQATAFFISAVELYIASGDRKGALAEIARINSSLEQIEKAISEFGSNRARWADLYRKSLTSGRHSLRAYINSTKSSDCLLQGPALRKP
jgi:hypothetical protein